MESILLNKRKLVEKHSKLELLPTYSYFRVYTYKSDLSKHTDRPSCEISITVHINSDGTPWEIYMGGKRAGKNSKEIIADIKNSINESGKMNTSLEELLEGIL